MTLEYPPGRGEGQKFRNGNFCGELLKLKFPNNFIIKNCGIKDCLLIWIDIEGVKKSPEEIEKSEVTPGILPICEGAIIHLDEAFLTTRVISARHIGVTKTYDLC